MALNIANGQLVQDTSLKAPTYKDPYFDFNGQTYQGMLDPGLQAQMNYGGQGGLSNGIGAFLQPNAATSFNSGGKVGYDAGTLKGLAGQFGIDVSKYGDDDVAGMQDYLNSQLKDYVGVSGLSGNWNPSGDPRQANNTIYKRENGQLVPYQTAAYSAPTQGSWLAENPEFLYSIAPLAAGAAVYGAGLAGAGGTTAASGTTAATGAGATGLSGSVANALGLGAQWGSLSAVQQAAVLGALQGGATGAMNGGGLKGALKGAALGGFTGGVGAWAGPTISSLTGMPGWAGNAVGASGVGALRAGLTGGNPWAGAASAGIGSLVGSGLSGAGANSYIAGLGGNIAGGFAGNTVNSLTGGSGGSRGGGGMSGGYTSASGTQAGGAGGMSGGAIWQHKPTQGEVGNAQFVAASGAPIRQEAAQAALIERLKDDPELLARLQA